jgi:hypothetical protein
MCRDLAWHHAPAVEQGLGGVISDQVVGIVRDRREQRGLVGGPGEVPQPDGGVDPARPASVASQNVDELSRERRLGRDGVQGQRHAHPFGAL